jgi:hypothetical protein
LEGFSHVYQHFNKASSVSGIIENVFEKVELFHKMLEDDALLYWYSQLCSNFDEHISEEVFQSVMSKNENGLLRRRKGLRSNN